MADELRLIFIIIGALVLGALLLHGLWTVRKNAGQPRHRYYDEQPSDSRDGAERPDGFDDLGVGPVRVLPAKRRRPNRSLFAALSRFGLLPSGRPLRPRYNLSWHLTSQKSLH
jgi:FtsZ-interacting cell division protein ZipA